MKKILSVLLAALMITVVFCFNAFAADETVNAIEITDVVEPALNSEATAFFKIPENSGYTYDSYDISEYVPCSWIYNSSKPQSYDEIVYDGESLYLSETVGFTKPGYYTFSAFVQVKDGYTFADGVTATVNGKTANIFTHYSGYATVYYTFDYLDDVDFEDISTVNISGVSAPVDGAVAKFGCTFPGTAEYSKFCNEATEREPFDPSVKWIVTATKPASWSDVENGEYCYSNYELKFEKGKFYTFAVRANASNGYEFTSSTKFTINSLDANAELLSDFEAEVWYTFEVADKKKVTSIELIGVVPPVFGEELSFNCSINQIDSGYKFNYGVWYVTEKKPESLDDLYSGKLIRENMLASQSKEKFSDKYYYTFYAFAETDGGYFDPALTATVNGKAASVDSGSLSKGIAGVYYTFDKLPPSDSGNTPTDKKISSIKIIKAPDKLVYGYGEELDTTGLVVEAYYSDGSNAGVVDNSLLDFDGFETSSPGKKTVTVLYENVRTNFEITVNFSFLHWILYIVCFGWIWM